MFRRLTTHFFIIASRAAWRQKDFVVAANQSNGEFRFTNHARTRNLRTRAATSKSRERIHRCTKDRVRNRLQSYPKPSNASWILRMICFTNLVATPALASNETEVLSRIQQTIDAANRNIDAAHSANIKRQPHGFVPGDDAPAQSSD
jgi:hypothetical protein